MFRVLVRLGILVLAASACASASTTLVTVSSALEVKGDVKDQNQLIASLERFLVSSTNMYERQLSGFLVDHISQDEQAIMISGCAAFGRFHPERYSAFVVVVATPLARSGQPSKLR